MLLVWFELKDHVVGLQVLGAVIEHRQQSKVELMSMIYHPTIKEVLILPLVEKGSNVGIKLHLTALSLHSELNRRVLQLAVRLQPRVQKIAGTILGPDFVSVVNLHAVESPCSLEQLIIRNFMPQFEAVSQEALARPHLHQLIE